MHVRKYKIKIQSKKKISSYNIIFCIYLCTTEPSLHDVKFSMNFRKTSVADISNITQDFKMSNNVELRHRKKLNRLQVSICYNPDTSYLYHTRTQTDTNDRDRDRSVRTVRRWRTTRAGLPVHQGLYRGSSHVLTKEEKERVTHRKRERERERNSRGELVTSHRDE